MQLITTWKYISFFTPTWHQKKMPHMASFVHWWYKPMPCLASLFEDVSGVKKLMYIHASITCPTSAFEAILCVPMMRRLRSRSWANDCSKKIYHLFDAVNDVKNNVRHGIDWSLVWRPDSMLGIVFDAMPGVKNKNKLIMHSHNFQSASCLLPEAGIFMRLWHYRLQFQSSIKHIS